MRVDECAGVSRDELSPPISSARFLQPPPPPSLAIAMVSTASPPSWNRRHDTSHGGGSGGHPFSQEPHLYAYVRPLRYHSFVVVVAYSLDVRLSTEAQVW